MHKILLPKNTIYFKHLGNTPPPCASHSVFRVDVFLYVYCSQHQILYSYNLSSHEWNLVQVDGSYPSSRWAHSTVVYQNKAYILGGTNEYGAFHDDLFYCLDLNELKWDQLHYHGRLLAWHSAVVYKNKMIVCDGDIIEEFNFDLNEWNQVDTNGPSVYINNHSAIVYKDSMFVFAGKQNGITSNQLWELNLKTYDWNHVPTFGDIPSIREGHSAVLFRNSMIVIGGIDRYGSNPIYTYVYILNLNTMRWEKLSFEYLIELSFHRSVIIEEKLFVFGGYGNETYCNDLLEYRLDYEDHQKLYSCCKKKKFVDVVFD